MRMRRRVPMKKLLYVILLAILGLMAFAVMKYKSEEVTEVKYKTVTRNGATFDVPENYVETYQTSNGRYSYSNKSGTFSMAIEASVAGDTTIDQYFSYVKQLLSKGYVDLDYGTYRGQLSNISNSYISEDDVIKINGINMGYLVVDYDQKVKDKTYHVTEKLYCIIEDNRIIQFSFVSETDKEEKYQAIVDHVVQSISIQ